MSVFIPIEVLGTDREDEYAIEIDEFGRKRGGRSRRSGSSQRSSGGSRSSSMTVYSDQGDEGEEGGNGWEPAAPWEHLLSEYKRYKSLAQRYAPEGMAGDDGGSGPGTRSRRWGRPMLMGERGNLSVAAAKGYRVGVVNLGDGLFLVGEYPESAATDFGFLPLAVPLMVRAATRKLKMKGGEKAQKPGRTGQGKVLWQRLTQGLGPLRKGHVEAPSWVQPSDAVEMGFAFNRF